MKTVHVLRLIAILSLGVFISCNDEPIDPALANNATPTNSCSAPTSLTVSDFINSTTVNVSWNSNGGASWQVQYGTHGFILGSGTSVVVTNTGTSVTGLVSTTNYDFYVRTICGTSQYSSWTGPVSVGSTAVSCATPTSFTVVRSTTNATSATATWHVNGNEASWEVQYGVTGFAIGTGTTVPATTATKTITGLTASIGYSFYVRSICSATDASVWVGPINIAAVQSTDNSPALMTANIDGTQYNFMKPYLYGFTGVDVQILNNGAPPADPRYLWIQGDTSDDLNTLTEIDLYIPTFEWAPGTYALNEQAGFSGYNFAQAHLISHSGTDTVTNVVNSGWITVTEFNLSTKRIKGTFNFVYQKTVNGTAAGTLQVNSGTFNYALDDPYFN